MAIWSNVGKFIGNNAGTIGDVGRGVVGMAGAATENRGEANKEQLTRDSIQASAARDYENALQQRAKLALDQQEAAQRESADAYKQALYAALAKNTQDVKFDVSKFRSNVPDISFSGGSRPSAIGEEGRRAADIMGNQALQRLMNPQKPQEMPAPEKFQASAPKEAGFWENLAGPAGGIMSTVGNIVDRGKTAADVAGKVAGIAGGAAPLFGAGGSTGLAASTIGTGGGFAGSFGGGGGAAATGAGIGAAGAATLGIGAAAAAAYMLWKGNRNDTKEDREDFAKKVGYDDLGQFYSHLETMGPQGVELARVGRSVIGKKDKGANQQWVKTVTDFLQQQDGQNA